LQLLFLIVVNKISIYLSRAAAAAAETKTATAAAAAEAKATVKPSLPEEPKVTVDAATKKMIIKFATVSSTEPALSWTFGGKAIAMTGGQYSMSKVVKDGQYFYTFEISEVHLVHFSPPGNESVPKIFTNDNVCRLSLFYKTAVSILLISNHDSFRVLFDTIASV